MACMKLRYLVFSMAITVCAVGIAFAHHPYGATYVENDTTQIEGKLVQFDFKDPHSFIQIESKDEKGQVVRWNVEWAAATQLQSQGVTARTLKYGDVFTITGNPGKLPDEHRVRLLTLKRKSDSFSWGVIH
jgi:hypothetical protein